MSSTPVRGTCAGYAVASALDFETLRTGGADQPLLVTEADLGDFPGEPVASWQARPNHAFHGRLVRDGRRYGFWASDVGWYVVDPVGATVGMPASQDPLRRELRLFGVPTTLCLLERGDVAIHAAAVDVGGRGVLLAGPSRFGKTTLAGAFAAAGDRLLAEDTTAATTRIGPAVFPGPAAIRLRPDVVDHIAVPGRAVRATDDDRTHIVLDPSVRGDGAPIPLSAILFLRHADDGPSLAVAPTADAIRDLWNLSFKLPDHESQARCFERIAELVASVECLDLRRSLRIDQLPAVIDLVRRHLGR